MARLSFDDITRLELDFKAIADIPKNVKEDMLSAGAKVLIDAQKKTARSMGVYDHSQRYPAKHVADSPKQTRVYHNDDGANTYVYPQGTRKRANKVTKQDEIAFVNEFGKRGQPARQFIRTANEKSANEIAEAEMKVYDGFLKKNNL